LISFTESSKRHRLGARVRAAPLVNMRSAEIFNGLFKWHDSGLIIAFLGQKVAREKLEIFAFTTLLLLANVTVESGQVCDPARKHIAVPAG